MLVALIPEQVRDNWAQLCPLIMQTFPAGSGITAHVPSNILRAILSGEATVWAWYEEREDLFEPRISAFVMTSARLDKVTGVRTLFIYSLIAVEQIASKRIWTEGLETLEKHARASGCRSLSALTDHDGLATYLDSQGWSTSMRHIAKEV